MIRLIKGEPVGLPKDDEIYIFLEETSIYIQYKNNKKAFTELIQGLFYDVNRFIRVLHFIVTSKWVSESCLINKDTRAAVCAVLGRPKTLQKVFRAIISELLIDDLKPHVYRLCLTR